MQTVNRPLLRRLIASPIAHRLWRMAARCTGRGRTAMMIIAGASSLACRADHAQPLPTITLLDSLVTDERSVTLSVDDSVAIDSWVAGLAIGRTVALINEPGAVAEIFDTENGHLMATVGGPGDAEGQFRRPVSVAALDGGNWGVLDQGRRVVVVLDSLHDIVGETRLPPGLYTSLMPAPHSDHILVTGDVFPSRAAVAKGKLHEFRLDGMRVASSEVPDVTSGFRAKLGAPFGVRLGNSVVTGAMNTSDLIVDNYLAGATRRIPIAPGWYRLPEWPSESYLRQATSKQSTVERLRDWLHAQRLANGIFSVGLGRVLVRIQAYDATARRFNYYVVADTTGRTIAISAPTRRFVVTTKSDTLFWVVADSAGHTQLGIARLRAALR